MESIFDIHVCLECGLRFPTLPGDPLCGRCPACLGNTRVIMTSHSRGESAARDGYLEHRTGLSVLLDNVRSAWNVGSILRTADGFGFRHAYLCGITPTPENEAVTKTSLGAEDSVPWSYHKDSVRLAAGLKRAGFTTIALEDTGQSKDISSAAGMTEGGGTGIVLIVGNEVAGVDPGLLDLCDAAFHIPMQGIKKSFNVATAFGIAAYAFK